MSQEYIDYDSPCPTFSLAFSPLGSSSSNSTLSKSTSTSNSSPSLDLKLAIGSFIETYSNNHVTVIGLQPTNGNGYENNHENRYEDSSSSSCLMNDGPSSTSYQFQPLAKAPHPYPPTSLSFSPTRLSESLQASSGNSNQLVRTREMLATSSDCIRLWDFAHGAIEDGNDRSSGYVGGNSSNSNTNDNHRRRSSSKSTGYQLVLRSQMANSKADYSAPLTSFSWSQIDPSLIVTSSIDTTCTVWDISSSSAITQLIAHDREVYDVCWSSSSRDIFASVGADGSVRMFDLRSLDHSTILYESQPIQQSSSSSNPANQNNLSSIGHGNGRMSGNNNNNNNNNNNHSSSNSNSNSAGTPLSPSSNSLSNSSPLLRLKFNPVDSNYIAVSSAVGFDVQVLDVRAPGVPIIELRAHQAPVNGLAWSGDGNVLGTCGDDSQVLIWDLSNLQSSSGGISNHQARSSNNPNSSTTNHNSNSGVGTGGTSTNNTNTTTNTTSNTGTSGNSSTTKVIKDPILGCTSSQEVNCITWSEAYRDWLAIGLGKKIRCLKV